METLLKGVCRKSNFLNLFKNFVLFDDNGERLIKIVAQNQQYLGANRAIRSVETRHNLGTKLGVIWHTQGAGKSYSMVFFSRKVHRKLGGNFTFLVLCDRDDLDNQIYRTYAGCSVVGEYEEMRTDSGKHLKHLLGEHKAYVFSLIQKFNEDVVPNEPNSFYKRAPYKCILQALGPGVVFVNADVTMSADPARPWSSATGYGPSVWFSCGIEKRRAYEHFDEWAVEDTYFPLDYELTALRKVGFHAERMARPTEHSFRRRREIRFRCRGRRRQQKNPRGGLVDRFEGLPARIDAGTGRWL